MRIFIAGLDTETNTFAPWPTGLQGFYREVFSSTEAVTSQSVAGQLARLWRSLANDAGHEVVQGLFAYAEPSGPTVQAVYEGFCREILGPIQQQGPFDVVLMLLHGAMVATECDDCEGDILAQIRKLVGPATVIGAVLDPHAHLSPLMVSSANILIACKHYPHDDYEERARELFDVCIRTRRGAATPTYGIFDCQMIGGYPTTQPLMADFVSELKALEQEPGILSASLIHGFPWGDTPDTGTKMMVIANGDAVLAARSAERFGRRLYKMREQLLPSMLSVHAALDQALSLDGLVVLAERADNPGGGAPGDNTALLDEMIRRKIEHAAVACIWDPVVAMICAEAGEGTFLKIRLGGKSGPSSGRPLDVRARVRAIRDKYQQTGLGATKVDLGLTVWLDIDGVAVVVSSIRSQVFHPDVFTGLGIDLAALKTLGVKSAQHFRTGFDPIARHVISVTTPGALDFDFGGIHYVKRRPLPYYPRVADPLAQSAVALPG
jgi:microcystin degradation protein MlrC